MVAGKARHDGRGAGIRALPINLAFTIGHYPGSSLIRWSPDVHIAVIIPAYNAARFLPICLASVRAQTHGDWSAHVIDDGSSDDTASVPIPYFRITLHRRPHLGVSAARNHGLSQAPRADAVMFLDADDWLARDALSRLASTLEACPWAVAAAGANAFVQPDGRTRLAARPPSGSLLERLLVRNLFANGGQLLIHREALETAGLFRPDLPYGEDWEFWTRLAALGEFITIPHRNPVLHVREHQESAYRRMAIQPARVQAVLAAIYANPAHQTRLGTATLHRLRAKAEAEQAWVIGRELVRHGKTGTGLAWLRLSLRQAPSVRRAVLFMLAGSGLGPFRLYKFPGAGPAGPIDPAEAMATISP